MGMSIFFEVGFRRISHYFLMGFLFACLISEVDVKNSAQTP